MKPPTEIATSLQRDNTRIHRLPAHNRAIIGRSRASRYPGSAELPGAGFRVSDNTSTVFFGGGIANEGTLTLVESAVRGNTANEGGGGIVNAGGTLTLVESTVSDNTAAFGGGIFNTAGGTVTLVDSTVSNNTPDDCNGC